MVAIDGGGQPGIDHCFVLQHPSVAAENAAGEGELTPKYAAKVSDPISGRFVQVETTQPGIQVYTGNFLSQRTATDYPFIQHNAMCLETQHFPNSPNMKGVFQSPFVTPNKPYSHLSIFTIGVDK
jgi:aldose 1-epimerase